MNPGCGAGVAPGSTRALKRAELRCVVARGLLATPTLLSLRPRRRLLAAPTGAHRLDAAGVKLGRRVDLARAARRAPHALAHVRDGMVTGSGSVAGPRPARARSPGSKPTAVCGLRSDQQWLL